MADSLATATATAPPAASAQSADPLTVVPRFTYNSQECNKLAVKAVPIGPKCEVWISKRVQNRLNLPEGDVNLRVEVDEALAAVVERARLKCINESGTLLVRGLILVRPMVEGKFCRGFRKHGDSMLTVVLSSSNRDKMTLDECAGSAVSDVSS